jgi:two-component system, NarL family, invasion response regulator UvrY
MLTKKILIADDHSAIRKGVKMIVSNEFMNADFGEAVNAQEVLEKVHSESWDVVILDIDMPGRNGLDIMKQFRAERLQVPVLAFSMHREELIALRAIKLGAYGYISKDSADSELVNALHTIFLGKKYITPTIAELLASQLDKNESKTPHELLSDREFQTFLKIALGKPVSKIAQELSLSVPTICTYRARIIEKTGLKNNAEIAAYAIRNHLI